MSREYRANVVAHLSEWAGARRPRVKCQRALEVNPDAVIARALGGNFEWSDLAEPVPGSAQEWLTGTTPVRRLRALNADGTPRRRSVSRTPAFCGPVQPTAPQPRPPARP
jgi:hypothetical protein